MVNYCELDYDIENVLGNSENDESIILQKLSSTRLKFRSNLSKVIEEHFSREKKSYEKSKSNSDSISQINNQIKLAEKELDTVYLNQKIAEREISNIIKRQERIQENFKHIREEREQIVLEIVDLEQELEERRKEKKLDWDAVKRAYHCYKDKLNTRLRVDTVEDIEKVTVSFFVKDCESKYYVDLTHKDKFWKVEKIEPDLKKKHRNELNTVVDFTNDFQVKNIAAFLCKLRHIFLKYYCDEL